MANKTKIQWCDTSVNPTMGCPGCELWGKDRRSCYAGLMHDRFGGQPGWPADFNTLVRKPGATATVARMADLSGTARPLKPWLDGMPRLIFVSDMSDTGALMASDRHNYDFAFMDTEIVRVADTARGRRHVWLWLSKRPGVFHGLHEYLHERGLVWPTNLWIGTSVTDEGSTWRTNVLREAPQQTTRFVSIEPQVGIVNARECVAGMDWVIHGGESGPRARPFDLRWADDVQQACGMAGVPYFLKQLGAHCWEPMRNGCSRPIELADSHGGDWDEWPLNRLKARLRQVPLERALACVQTEDV